MSRAGHIRQPGGCRLLGWRHAQKPTMYSSASVPGRSVWTKLTSFANAFIPSLGPTSRSCSSFVWAMSSSLSFRSSCPILLKANSEGPTASEDGKGSPPDFRLAVSDRVFSAIFSDSRRMCSPGGSGSMVVVRTVFIVTVLMVNERLPVCVV